MSVIPESKYLTILLCYMMPNTVDYIQQGLKNDFLFGGLKGGLAETGMTRWPGEELLQREKLQEIASLF